MAPNSPTDTDMTTSPYSPMEPPEDMDTSRTPRTPTRIPALLNVDPNLTVTPPSVIHTRKTIMKNNVTPPPFNLTQKNKNKRDIPDGQHRDKIYISNTGTPRGVMATRDHFFDANENHTNEHININTDVDINITKENPKTDITAAKVDLGNAKKALKMAFQKAKNPMMLKIADQIEALIQNPMNQEVLTDFDIINSKLEKIMKNEKSQIGPTNTLIKHGQNIQKIPQNENTSWAQAAALNTKNAPLGNGFKVVEYAKHKNPFPLQTQWKEKRLIVTPTSPILELNPGKLRDEMNEAFQKAKVNITVATISKTVTGSNNIVIKTTENHNAEDLLKHRDIWNDIIKPTKVAKDETWHKVVVHGINTNYASNMHVLKMEIEKHNNGIKLINDPKWISVKHLEKSHSSIIINSGDEQGLHKALNGLDVDGLCQDPEGYSSVP